MWLSKRFDLKDRKTPDGLPMGLLFTAFKTVDSYTRKTEKLLKIRLSVDLFFTVVLWGDHSCQITKEYLLNI